MEVTSNKRNKEVNESSVPHSILLRRCRKKGSFAKSKGQPETEEDTRERVNRCVCEVLGRTNSCKVSEDNAALQRCLGAGSGGGRLPIPGDSAARGRPGLKTDSSEANRKDGRSLEQLCREGEGVKFTKEENTLWEFGNSFSQGSLVTAVNRGGHGDLVVREEGEQHLVNTAERSKKTRTETTEKHCRRGGVRELGREGAVQDRPKHGLA